MFVYVAVELLCISCTTVAAPQCWAGNLKFCKLEAGLYKETMDSKTWIPYKKKFVQ